MKLECRCETVEWSSDLIPFSGFLSALDFSDISDDVKIQISDLYPWTVEKLQILQRVLVDAGDDLASCQTCTTCFLTEDRVPWLWSLEECNLTRLADLYHSAHFLDMHSLVLQISIVIYKRYMLHREVGTILSVFQPLMEEDKQLSSGPSGSTPSLVDCSDLKRTIDTDDDELISTSKKVKQADSQEAATISFPETIVPIRTLKGDEWILLLSFFNSADLAAFSDAAPEPLQVVISESRSLIEELSVIRLDLSRPNTTEDWRALIVKLLDMLVSARGPASSNGGDKPLGCLLMLAHHVIYSRLQARGPQPLTRDEVCAAARAALESALGKDLAEARASSSGASAPLLMLAWARLRASGGRLEAAGSYVARRVAGATGPPPAVPWTLPALRDMFRAAAAAELEALTAEAQAGAGAGAGEASRLLAELGRQSSAGADSDRAPSGATAPRRPPEGAGADLVELWVPAAAGEGRRLVKAERRLLAGSVVLRRMMETAPGAGPLELQDRSCREDIFAKVGPDGRARLRAAQQIPRCGAPAPPAGAGCLVESRRPRTHPGRSRLTEGDSERMPLAGMARPKRGRNVPPKSGRTAGPSRGRHSLDPSTAEPHCGGAGAGVPRGPARAGNGGGGRVRRAVFAGTRGRGAPRPAAPPNRLPRVAGRLTSASDMFANGRSDISEII